MLRFFSTISTALLVAVTAAPLDRVRAQEADFPVVLPALTNGDVNGDWELDVSDPLALLGHLFLGGPAPAPVLCGTEVAASQNGDANGDGALDLSDAVHLLGFLFLGGPEPVSACGLESGAGAATERISVSFVATLFEPAGAPERQWVDDEGVTHVRGFPTDSALVGDFTGNDPVVFNQNVDPDGNGDAFGTFNFVVTWAGQSGAFAGRFSGPIEGGVITVDFVGQGSGDFDGMKIMGRAIENPDGSFPHEGIVLIPGGN